MKWKRCTVCKDLKPVEQFWKKGSGYQSICIKCSKKRYLQNKDKKRKYDKERYEKIKKENIKQEFVCMRCDEFVANVKNNSMYWCFHCLFKYEQEWKQIILVEVIDPLIRRSKYYKEKNGAVQQKK